MSARAPMASDHFLVFPEALRMHETMQASGFLLHDRVWPRQQDGQIVVRLVWRRRPTQESAVLLLRISVPRAH